MHVVEQAFKLYAETLTNPSNPNLLERKSVGVYSQIDKHDNI
jgi:hypothetical protein